MNTTNKTYILKDRSYAQIEQAVNAVLQSVCPKEGQFELPEAILLGFSFGEEEVDFRCIDSAGDIYELLDNPANKTTACLFDVVVVATCGWAAPLEPTGAVSEIRPIDHPDRVRVRLTLIAGEDGICSALRFANNPDDVTIDGSGRGPLADALAAFWADRDRCNSK